MPNNNHKTNLLISWLDKPYYLNQNHKSKLIIILAMLFGIMGFLILFEPIAIITITTNLHLFSIYTGCVIAGVLSIYYFIIQNIFKEYIKNDDWTIGKHILVFIMIFISSSIINWNTNPYINKSMLILSNDFFNFFKTVLKVGVFPMSLYLFLDERIGKIHAENNNKLVIKSKQIDLLSEKITISSYNLKENITFDIADLVLVTYQSNYAKLYILERYKLKEYTLRVSLKKIEEDLVFYEQFIRCHKSFIINQKFIDKNERNGNDYYITLDYYKDKIPISRSLDNERLAKILH